MGTYISFNQACSQWKLKRWGLCENKTSAVHFITLQWRQNGLDSVSNHQPYDGLLKLLFRHRSKKTSKLHVTGLCAWNSTVTGEFPAQRPVTRKMFPFDDVIIYKHWYACDVCTCNNVQNDVTPIKCATWRNWFPQKDNSLHTNNKITFIET